jgi:hypothetical protein
MAVDNAKVLARHRRYNHSAKGLARYKRYASTPAGKSFRQYWQIKRRGIQRMQELHGCHRLTEHDNQRTYGRCPHCRCKPPGARGYKHCKWCREKWDAAELFYGPIRSEHKLQARRARWNHRRRTSEEYKESRRFYMRSKRRAIRIAENKL